MEVKEYDLTSIGAQLRATMSVYARQRAAARSGIDRSIDVDDDALLHEAPSSRDAQRRIIIKEFVVRAFLYEEYDQPKYSYRTLMPLVSVQIIDSSLFYVTVSSNDKVLLDHYIKWYRDRSVPGSNPHRPFFNSLIIHPNGLLNVIDFEGSNDDLTTIYEIFLGPDFTRRADNNPVHEKDIHERMKKVLLKDVTEGD